MRVVFAPAGLIPLALFLAVLPAAAQSAREGKAPMYPQLIATRYPTGTALPDGVAKPTPRYDFVDRAKLPDGATIRSAARAATGVAWIVTDRGNFRVSGGRYERLEWPRVYRPRQEPINEDAFVTCVAADRDGHLWAGTTNGVYATDGADWWRALDRRDGMPIDHVSCLYLAPNGDLWAGTDEGAWRMRAGQFRYFWGLRWLPGNRVSTIWGDDRGRVWLETDGGTSCIEETKMTLGHKANVFNDLTQKWNNRRGFINERALKTPGELAGSVFDVSDNDGLWNSIYVGAMAFRYAATRDPEAKRQGWQALEAMLELERLTGIPGYPARAVVTDEELAAGATGFDPNETVRVDGETDKIWFRSKVEKNVWCKGDTSSDELDGHYFAWLTYYDLVATDEEKRKIAATCRRVTDNIIAGGYNLIGHTGRKTRWGVWAPKFLNDAPFWWDQRPLNSLELLSYLKAAYHLTGDAKYEQHYEKLIREDHYLLNTLDYRTRRGGKWQHINHSDDEMGYMNYYVLLTLEQDPDRRRLLLQSFRNTWEEGGEVQSLKPERSPLYNYLYGGLTGRPCAPEEAEETLQDWPWDRVEWSMRNSQRDDVTFKEGRGLRTVSELTRVLPISERCLHRWNGNPWSPDGGSDGREYDDGAAWLLGYWAGVHFGYLSAER
jgi:hypothetical protein